jgi:formate dehydrogenase major subunit
MLTLDPFKSGCGSSKGFERKMQTVCRECTAGCGIWTFIEGERIVGDQGDPSHPVNRGRLCSRGSAFTRLLCHPDRITNVLHRKSTEEELEPLDSWESGLDLMAEKPQQAKTQQASTFGTNTGGKAWNQASFK